MSQSPYTSDLAFQKLKASLTRRNNLGPHEAVNWQHTYGLYNGIPVRT